MSQLKAVAVEMDQTPVAGNTVKPNTDGIYNETACTGGLMMELVGQRIHVVSCRVCWLVFSSHS